MGHAIDVLRSIEPLRFSLVAGSERSHGPIVVELNVSESKSPFSRAESSLNRTGKVDGVGVKSSPLRRWAWRRRWILIHIAGPSYCRE